MLALEAAQRLEAALGALGEPPSSAGSRRGRKQMSRHRRSITSDVDPSVSLPTLLAMSSKRATTAASGLRLINQSIKLSESASAPTISLQYRAMGNKRRYDIQQQAHCERHGFGSSTGRLPVPSAVIENMPAPGKYKTPEYQLAGGRINTGERVTPTMATMRGDRSKTPGPSSYRSPPAKRGDAGGAFIGQASRVTSTNEAIKKAAQVPGVGSHTFNARTLSHRGGALSRSTGNYLDREIKAHAYVPGPGGSNSIGHGAISPASFSKGKQIFSRSTGNYLDDAIRSRRDGPGPQGSRQHEFGGSTMIGEG